MRSLLIFVPSSTSGDYLLTPTKIYVKSLLAPMQAGLILAAAHITGGGLLENIPRVLPKSVDAEIHASQWPLPPILRWLMAAGNVDTREMARTFNCGIGMVLLVKGEHVAEVVELVKKAGEEVFEIGDLVPGTGEVDLKETEVAWESGMEGPLLGGRSTTEEMKMVDLEAGRLTVQVQGA